MHTGIAPEAKLSFFGIIPKRTHTTCLTMILMHTRVYVHIYTCTGIAPEAKISFFDIESRDAAEDGSLVIPRGIEMLHAMYKQVWCCF